MPCSCKRHCRRIFSSRKRCTSARTDRRSRSLGSASCEPSSPSTLCHSSRNDLTVCGPVGSRARRLRLLGARRLAQQRVADCGALVRETTLQSSQPIPSLEVGGEELFPAVTPLVELVISLSWQRVGCLVALLSQRWHGGGWCRPRPTRTFGKFLAKWVLMTIP